MKKEMTMQETFAHMEEVAKDCGEEIIRAAGMFEDPTRFPVDQLIQLSFLQQEIYDADIREERLALNEKFRAAMDQIHLLPDAPERIYLWQEGNMPTQTVYTENPGFKNNHNPDYKPYMLEMLVKPEVQPIGAIVMVAGGNHGAGTINECYQNCLEFNALGYQCFILNCRPNHWPWNTYDTGVDAARALRLIRANAAKYRIAPDHVALAGFSNGGVTVDCCIQYYSGKQRVADYYPDYVPDELDALNGGPDAFLCVYGPRYKGMPYDWNGVVYPPTFFAVGRNDTAMDNLHATYADLLAHNVPLEVHTFAGRPHGNAGWKIIDGVGDPNFDLWVTHADYFLRDIFC